MRVQLKLDSDCRDVIVSLVIKAGIDCTSDLSFNFQTSPQSSGNSAFIIKSLFMLVCNILKIDRALFLQIYMYTGNTKDMEYLLEHGMVSGSAYRVR